MGLMKRFLNLCQKTKKTTKNKKENKSHIKKQYIEINNDIIFLLQIACGTL